MAHPLVHTYAREQAAVGTAAVRRLGEYYAALAETESAKGLPGYQRLNPERGHILAVLRRLAAAREWAAANRLAWAVAGHGSYLDVQGYPLDRIAALEVGLAAARELDRKYDQMAHLNHLGLAYAGLGQVERAIEFYEAALAIAREIGDRQGEGNHLGNLGAAYYRLGQVERALSQYEAALAIVREIGDRGGEGNHLFNLGLALEQLGRRAAATESFVAALAIYEAIKSPYAARAREQLARLRGEGGEG